MKKIILTGILIFFLHLSFSQDNVRIWNLTTYDDDFTPQHPNPTWKFHGLKSCGDTLLEGISYSKLYISTDTLFSETTFIGGMREDSNRIYLSKSVYSAKEILLYDFSLIVGDTLTVRHLLNIDKGSNYPVLALVDSINSIYINGNLKKQFFISYICHEDGTVSENDIWIEGIGSIKKGLLNERCSCFTGCYTTTFLTCYYETPM